MRTYTARWIFPVSGPPLERGTITIDGDKIASVDPPGVRTPDEDLGEVAILPGFVNAHTHLDLSGARGLIPPTDPDHFTDWLKGVIAYRRGRSLEQVQQDIRDGLQEVLVSGTTLVGDITSGGVSWDTLSFSRDPKGSDLRTMVFWELIGFNPDWGSERYETFTNWWNDKTTINQNLRKAVSPHSPYSVHWSAFGGGGGQDCFTSHLAESPGEMELLQSRTGPFVEFLRSLGVWDEKAIAPLQKILIRTRYLGWYLLAHCNYLPMEYLRYLSDSHTVVYCPRTHAAFGHPPHPFREFLARGVRVCLGTDSLASNPDLDILAEARFVKQHHPDFPSDQLLKMITLAGAEALGWADECGSLEVGKSADFVVLPLKKGTASDPHDLFLLDVSPPESRRTMFRGRWRL